MEIVRISELLFKSAKTIENRTQRVGLVQNERHHLIIKLLILAIEDIAEK
jgi:hypothetical protein